MASSVTYHLGGYKPAAPQQNRAELYDGAAGTYTSWDTSGVQTATRPLTAAEAAQLAADDAAIVSDTNQGALQSAVQARLAQIETFIANNPNGAVLTATQTNTLARMVVALARLTLKLTTTVGQGT